MKNILKDGITIAGSITLDKNKYINTYPMEGTLVSITKSSYSYGGCVSNTAVNLALIDPKTYIKVAGMVGNDNEGSLVVDFFKKYNFDTKQILINEQYNTSTVDAFINETSNTRTFFANLLVNNEFGKEKIECDTKYIHLGYVLLMPYLDEIENNQPRLKKWLEEYQKKGIKVSIDLVTDESNRYEEIVIPLLPNVNYLIINEIEASRITKIEVFENGELKINKLKEVAKKLKDLGVNDLVIIHAPDLGLIYNGNNYEILPSLNLPSAFIKSSVGAGDGFCAGALYGIMNNYSSEKILRLASSVAAGVLNSDTSQSNIKGLKKFLKLEKEYGRKKI